MGQPQSTPTKITTEPSQSLLRRLLGHNPNVISAGGWPELAQNWASREIEMPNETGQVNRIQPMGWLGKALSGGAYASSNPLTGIMSVNRDAIDKDNQNLGDVLTHELTHMGQGPMGMIRGLFSNQMEDEAVNAEAFRKVRRKDIHLRGK